VKHHHHHHHHPFIIKTKNIEETIQFADVIFGGDLNMELNIKSNLCKQLCSFASDLQLQFVDDKISSIDKCTFRAIDHFAVSENLYNHVHDVKVYYSGINLSDHCPLILMVDVLLSLAPNVSCSSNTRSLRVVMY